MEDISVENLKEFVVEEGPVITYSDFDKICRTCLSSTDLNDINGMVYEQQSISELLQCCVSIQVIPTDNLPQKICSNCLLELIKSFNFKQKCEITENNLKAVYESYLNSENEKLLHQNSNKEIIESQNECLESIIANQSNEEISEKEVENRPSKGKHKKKIKSIGPPFKCRDCGECFTTRDELSEHRKTAKHMEIRNHSCTVCNKSFTSSKLRQHMRTHTKEKPYKCKICLQAFSMSGNLKRHMMTHTGERPHVCEVCGKGFIQATTLTNHMRTHGSNEQISEDGSGPCFYCNFCGRSFKRLSRFKAHQQKHLSDNFEIKKAREIDENTKNQKQEAEYVCEICKRAYKTKHLLKAHSLTHGEKSFLCSECGKGFVTKAALLSHLKVHTGEKPHTCNICQKSFAHVGSFEAHILTHTGHKPYTCNVCGKAFTQLSHLKYHLRTHSGERPYICTYCNKSFALKGNLTVHIRIHTGETPYLCPVCGKGFYDSSSMKKHKKAHGDAAKDMENMEENNEAGSQLLNL